MGTFRWGAGESRAAILAVYSDRPGAESLIRTMGKRAGGETRPRRLDRTRDRGAMSSDEGGSVTRWVGGLQGGDPDAVPALWERYFARLVALARRRLASVRHGRAVEDEEDAALSAFESFCAGAALGRFPRLSG